MVKRVCEAIIALALILATLPVLVVCAIGTAVSLRAWPFFTQHRVGPRGVFGFVKLRTLPPHAPRYADKYVVNRLHAPAFCRALRRLHLDELPQLWLVVIGRMSLVGPRPEMPNLHARYDPAFAALRTSVRPGCTGLWQISEHCQKMIFEHPEFDEHYLRHRSLRLDTWILLRTVRLVLPFRRHRLVSLDDLPAWARHEPAEPVAAIEAGAAVTTPEPRERPVLGRVTPLVDQEAAVATVLVDAAVTEPSTLTARFEAADA